MTSLSVIRDKDHPSPSARRPWQILVVGLLCVLCLLATGWSDARAAQSSVDQYIEKVPSAEGPRYEHHAASGATSPATSPSDHKKGTSTTPAGAAGGGGNGSGGAPGAGAGSGAKGSHRQVLSTPSSTELQSASTDSSLGLVLAIIGLSIGGLASWMVGAKRRRRGGNPIGGPTT